ncbi:DUF2917 domain-containing protein [Aquabacterium sp. A08]|uniref:DUF2917 domain-containing protein n=1 Tax=Aquabacterium sp. A08 TaxID=2718532 RepID=UPI0014242171|nr:DUF2917 domain-containing protein [Aquabacterium sp. A08]NIC41587.1 DUF2917 domain-containing protein [Aquabacterium sp. A08]
MVASLCRRAAHRKPRQPVQIGPGSARTDGRARGAARRTWRGAVSVRPAAAGAQWRHHTGARHDHTRPCFPDPARRPGPDPASGRRLRVVSGRVWLTQSGDGTDHFLAPGQERVLGPGRAVLEADRGPVRYTLTASDQPQTVPARRGGGHGPVWGRPVTAP